MFPSLSLSIEFPKVPVPGHTYRNSDLTCRGPGVSPPKSERGRKKIKAENPGGPPVLVVPYPILASGETAKEGKTYRWGSWWEGVFVGLGQRPGA